MTWKEITVHTTSQAQELICDIFFELGSSGVSVSDSADMAELVRGGLIWDYVEDGALPVADGAALVRGYVTPAGFQRALADLNQKLALLKMRSEVPLGSLELVSRDIDDGDWIDIWKKHFKPIPVRGLIVCPNWIKLTEEVRGGRVPVTIEPGMAFGTGEHETTLMCLDLMQDVPLAGVRVLDIGCGSGILGAAALKMGAAHALLTDIDPIACESAARNCALNGVQDKADIYCGDLLSETAPKGELILMNIVAEVLLRFAPHMASFLTQGGCAVLSGILDTKLDAVVKAYGAAGFTVQRTAAMGDWRAVRLTKDC